jgi:hypothetical protein
MPATSNCTIIPARPIVAGGASRKRLLDRWHLAEPGEVATKESDQIAVNHHHANLSNANRALLDFALGSFTSVLNPQRMLFRVEIDWMALKCQFLGRGPRQ